MKGKEILGLSREFIPTKKHTARVEELEKSQFKFRRDAHLKTFFTGSLVDNKSSKLYVKSILRPLSDHLADNVGNIPEKLATPTY